MSDRTQEADAPVRPAMQAPPWRRVLVVVAHPDDESFGLGAVIDAFVASGARVEVLCLTAGEASTLVAGVEPGADLSVVRAAELREAADALGISATTLGAYPDGGLADLPEGTLTADIEAAVRVVDPDGLLVLDTSGVTGHPDHVAASRAAVEAAAAQGLPVLAWTLPGHVADVLSSEYDTAMAGVPEDAVDFVLAVGRARQRRAIAAHASQAVPGSILWRRLELLGDQEYLRWALPPSARARSDIPSSDLPRSEGKFSGAPIVAQEN